MRYVFLFIPNPVTIGLTNILTLKGTGTDWPHSCWTHRAHIQDGDANVTPYNPHRGSLLRSNIVKINVITVRFSGLMVSSLVALLSGCAKAPEPVVAATVQPSVISPLDRAADKVSNAWALLATENAAVNPPKGKVPLLPPALARVVPVTWTGPVSPLVAKLSSIAGYRFRPEGVAPAAPIIVHLSGSHSVFDALRDIAVQAGKRADITVNAKTQRVVLRYTGAQ
jgi:hypothetical protein